MQLVPRSKHFVSAVKIKLLMLHGEIAACSEIQTKRKGILWAEYRILRTLILALRMRNL